MVKVRGLKQLNNNLKQMKKNTKKLNGENKISFDELFDFNFMSTNTNFDNISDFFEFSGIKVNNQEEFNLLDETLLDEAVNRFTDFNSWEEMIDEAGLKYMEKQLFDGIKL